MAEEQVPDAWVGREVVAGFEIGGATKYEGTLESVGERGIVLRQEYAEATLTIFYPWRVVTWIYPSDDEGSGEREQEETVPGFGVSGLRRPPHPPM